MNKLQRDAVSIPTLSLVELIADEITHDLIGKSWRTCSPEVTGDGNLLLKVFFAANRLRYERMGVRTSKWPTWSERDRIRIPTVSKPEAVEPAKIAVEAVG
jgi:hypothetical protein